MQRVSNIIKKCFGYSNALLSGSMDIIAVKQPNGKLKATPLRLRFSNYRVPRAGRKKVTIKVNDKIVDVPMFLQKDGRAFILLENKMYKNNIVNNEIKDDIGNTSSKSLNENFSIKKVDKNINKIFNEEKENTVDSFDYKINNLETYDENTKNNILLNSDYKSKDKINDLDKDKNEKEENNNNMSIIIERENNDNFKLELSDCWNNINKNRYNKNFDIQGEFNKKLINKEEFFKDPWKAIKNPNLAIKYGNQIFTSNVIIPMMFSQLVYGSPLPEKVVNNLTEGKDGLFFWKTKHKDAYRIDLDKIYYSEEKSMIYNSDDPLSDSKSKTIYSDSGKKIKRYRMKKSSKFTSKILEKFELKEGINDIQYIVDGYTISSNIYLWNYTDKIVISDFDGTITRSDVIGQLVVYLGIDWTHKYIAKLYSHIANNGYKMLYLTARTMYMQSSTKNSLNSINQNGFNMPMGPIMMNDSGYIDSIKTEIIDKVPQEFKIECLFNILKLFPSDVDPFYAGIGNKPSDKFAYEKVGINPSKIYIVNERGEISTENNTNNKTNFLLMDKNINELFPCVKVNNANNENCLNKNTSDFDNIEDEKNP